MEKSRKMFESLGVKQEGILWTLAVS